MAENEPLSVLFLWHQHQPFYKDLLSNRYELPWVRLHATKDYVDMAALLEEYPSIRSNFNLVPSLLAQLDDYSTGEVDDKFIELTLKKASDLSFEDRIFILKNFFMANWGTMVEPWPRYRELLEKRGYTTPSDDFPRIVPFFKEQEWRDLQMWFNLTWMDPHWREHDVEIRSFFEKGKNYTELDKQVLVKKQTEICAQVVAIHKKLQDAGQIEISATPFYHPILPLLCDTEDAHMAMPNITLPRRFQHPEDAKLQIRRAIDDHTKRFGLAPRGFWPSEGSVSEPVAKLFIEQGILWVATDEAILEHSLKSDFKHEDIYRPWVYRYQDKELHFFFRDHSLSDAIGFVYATWDPKDAAQDFVNRLKGIQQKLGPGPHVVPVILDGENCWEYYKDDGRPFLKELYRLLSEEATLKTVRATDYLKQTATQDKKVLPRLWAGSWINSNFSIWIAHSEDRLAWDLLQRTRDFLTTHLQNHPELKGQANTELAWEEILIAEGSDWCWWYGTDHSSANDETFDYLFRKHLMNVYSLVGVNAPEDLHLPIKASRKPNTVLAPTDFVTPKLDGKVTTYFEWLGAGVYLTDTANIGTMHRVQNVIQAIYFGFDLKKLYLRIDLAHPAHAVEWHKQRIHLIFLKPQSVTYEVTIDADRNVQVMNGENVSGEGSIQKVLELAIPIIQIPGHPAPFYEIVIALIKDGQEQERWPTNTTINIPHPTPDAFSESWTV